MSFVQHAQRTCAGTYLVALALQFYAAGLAVFGVTSFVPHALLGVADRAHRRGDRAEQSADLYHRLTLAHQ